MSYWHRQRPNFGLMKIVGLWYAAYWSDRALSDPRDVEHKSGAYFLHHFLLRAAHVRTIGLRSPARGFRRRKFQPVVKSRGALYVYLEEVENRVEEFVRSRVLGDRKVRHLVVNRIGIGPTAVVAAWKAIAGGNTRENGDTKWKDQHVERVRRQSRLWVPLANFLWS